MVQEVRTFTLRPRTNTKHLVGDSLFNGARGSNIHPTGNLSKPPSCQPSQALYHKPELQICEATISFSAVNVDFPVIFCNLYSTTLVVCLLLTTATLR